MDGRLLAQDGPALGDAGVIVGHADQLRDPWTRAAWVERVFARARWARLPRRPRTSALTAFHASQKMTLLAHSPAVCRDLGQLVAGTRGRPAEDLAATYRRRLLEALSSPASPNRHVNVLQHLSGHIADAQDRVEVATVIEGYCRGDLPLETPVGRIREGLDGGAPVWLRIQTYLDPFPAEVMLGDRANQRGGRR
ncbi:MAG TPA: DUF1722 domain-containing protein [Candidatus Dormibacteraeota bacterium]|nr:DUF1722 domain-containing protein [Candidatus Dormibacteraeota bacterium]